MPNTTEDHEHLIESGVKIYLEYNADERRWDIAMSSADGHPLDEITHRIDETLGRPGLFRCRYQHTHAKLPEGPERSQVFADCELMLRDAANVSMPTLVELIAAGVYVLTPPEEGDVAKAYIDQLAIEANQ